MLPILFQSHDFILYSYPLLMGLGWGIAYQIFFSYAPTNVSRLKLQILFWGLFLSAWVGAKVLFYLTYPEQLGTEYLVNASFWTGGGFVFYGGFLGGILFLALYKLFDRSLSLNTLWPMLPALSIGHGIGRLGCFLAGCCYGKPTDWVWAVFMHGHDRHPTQILEAIGLLIIGIYLIKSKAPRITLLSHYLLSYGLLRFSIEMLRGDAARGEWGVLSPSQWISLTLILAGLLIKLNKFKSLSKSSL